MQGRADKKTQYAPYLPVWIKEIVGEIGEHLNLAMGDTAARIVMESSRHTAILDRLAPYFWRPLERGDHTWPGQINRADIADIIKYPYERCERLKFRLTQDERREIDDLMLALSVPDAHAVAALLVLGIHDKRIISSVAPRFAPRSRYAIERRADKWAYSTR